MKYMIQAMLRVRGKSGVTAILVAVMLVMLLGFAALAIDIGYGMVTKNELQNVADAAALAGASQLGAIYEDMTYQDQQNFNPTTASCSSYAPCTGSTNCADCIISVAQNVANQNKAGGVSISIAGGEAIIGQWDSSPSVTGDPFTTPTPLLHPDAVRVIARRDTTFNLPITTFFAKIFGISNMNVSARATAALTGESTAGSGGLPPIGISERWFETPTFCGNPIRMYPTCSKEPCDPVEQGCGGWHTFLDKPNADTLRDIINGIKAGTYVSPEVIAGKTQVDFIGGTITNAIAAFKELFDVMKIKNDGVLDGDNNSDTWTTRVVVYDSSDCTNPNEKMTVVGFTTIVITNVEVTPEKLVDGMVLCNIVEPGRGGGTETGTMGSIPGLVQ